VFQEFEPSLPLVIGTLHAIVVAVGFTFEVDARRLADDLKLHFLAFRVRHDARVECGNAHRGGFTLPIFEVALNGFGLLGPVQLGLQHAFGAEHRVFGAVGPSKQHVFLTQAVLTGQRRQLGGQRKSEA